jgi:phosphatidate cytidylyltransferase
MSDPAPAPQPPSKARTFVRRLTSTTILWTIVLAAMFSGNKLVSDFVFATFMVVLACVGLMEFYGLVEKRGLVCFKALGITAGALMMVVTSLHCTGHFGRFDQPALVNDFESTILILFVLGLCVRQFVSKSNTAGILAISTTLFGLMYVPWLLNFIQKINFFPGINDNGKFFVLYFILVTKFSDTGAYAIGSLIGKHKMIPRISPGENLGGLRRGDSGRHRREPDVHAFPRRQNAGHDAIARRDSGRDPEFNRRDWRLD